jgi:hypothetical protein
LGKTFWFTDSINGKAFTVTNGNITVADAFFVNSANNTYLFLGTPGNNGYYNELTGNHYAYADFSNATTQFTAATSTPVPFESSPIALPASLAVCFGAAKLRRNHLAKKRMVSVEA